MRRILYVIILVMLILSSTASAKNGNFGLGVIIGEPTGISGKLWLNNKHAVDGAVAWSTGKNNDLHLHADYLLHLYDLITVEKGKLPLYFGIGGRIKFETKSNAGVRIPVGLNYMFVNTPLDIFLEVVPLLELAPDTDFDFNAAVGIRFFF